jgi:hypothetical protein
MGRLTEQPRQPGVQVPVVHGVSELVQHRAHPLFVRPQVAEHPNVRATIHCHTEGVLALAGLLIQIRTLEQTGEVESDRGEETPGQVLE